MTKRTTVSSARDREVSRIATHLSVAEYPRLGMLGLISASGGVGFLASVSLLSAGLASPALRYPLAAAGAYAAFLGLMRVWLWWRKSDRRVDVDGLDLGHLGDASASVSDAGFGGGGGFSGGGSSGGFSSADAGVRAVAQGAEAKSTVLEGALGAAAEADEGAVVLVPLVVLAAAVVLTLGVSASVLYNAPALFAELLLDGVLAAVVYRRVRGRAVPHWAAGVLRRTWKPMLGIATILFALGAAIQVFVPGADSIGDLFR